MLTPDPKGAEVTSLQKCKLSSLKTHCLRSSHSPTCRFLSKNKCCSLCCRRVLIALRETCIFTKARAATSVAAKSARVPHGPAAVVRRRRSLATADSRDKSACIHGWFACAFVRLRRPKAPLREPFLPLLISALDARTPRSARQRARPLRGRCSKLATLAPPAVKVIFNTILQHSRHR